MEFPLRTNVDSKLKLDISTWTIAKLHPIREKLRTKKLDVRRLKDEDRLRWGEITKRHSETAYLRKYIMKRHHTPNVSLAWLKSYEIFKSFTIKDIISHPSDSTFVYFDAACLPGGSIYAFNHLMVTHAENVRYQWFGQSLDKKKFPYALGDVYNLQKKYPQRFFTEGDGDLTKVATHIPIVNRLGGKVHLYFADLGIDSKSDDQEGAHAHGNLGQITLGLKLLAHNGTLIAKMYTTMHSFTISLIDMLCHCFKKVSLMKPMSSTPTNSEVYIVCKYYVGINPDAIIFLDNYLSNFTCRPIKCRKRLINTASFYTFCATSLALEQIRHLDACIAKFRKPVDSTGQRNQDPIAQTGMLLSKCRQWLSKNYVVPVDTDPV